MKFSIGDAVLLKRTGEEGRIVAFLSKTMLEVEVAGIHFPVYQDEVDHPYLKWFTEKKTAQQKARSDVEIRTEQVKERKARLTQGIYLSFMPVFLADSFEDIVTHFRIFFINETAATVYFNYDVRAATGRKIFHHQASLHPFANVYLHPLTLEEMNGQPRFHWAIGDTAASLQSAALKGLLRIKAAKLFEHINRLLEANEPAFNYLLSDDATATPVLVKAPPRTPAAFERSKDTPQLVTDWKPKEVLDLHIDMLVNNAAELSIAEILNIQLDVLEYHLDMALAHNQQRMVIIHGIGTGRLREEVNRVLAGKEGIDAFDNGWHGLYGHGATIVTFQVH